MMPGQMLENGDHVEQLDDDQEYRRGSKLCYGGLEQSNHSTGGGGHRFENCAAPEELFEMGDIQNTLIDGASAEEEEAGAEGSILHRMSRRGRMMA
jgi:hypothetical protein